MKYSIVKWKAPSKSLHHNDGVSPAPYAEDGGDLFDTEEHGHPVVIMESGVEDLDDGGAIYYEKMGVHDTPVKSNAEAIEVAKSYIDEEDGMRFFESHGLQDGGGGEVDYYAVEILKLIEEEV